MLQCKKGSSEEFMGYCITLAPTSLRWKYPAAIAGLDHASIHSRSSKIVPVALSACSEVLAGALDSVLSYVVLNISYMIVVYMPIRMCPSRLLSQSDRAKSSPKPHKYAHD